MKKHISIMQLPILNENALNLIANHLKRLDYEDRRSRFGMNMPDEAIDKYVSSLDHMSNVAFVAFNDTLEVVAFVHIAISSNNVAEIGISVDKEFREQKLGSAIWKRAVSWCRMHGIKQLFTHCLMTNTPMIKLARKENMILESSCGETDAYLELAEPTFDIAINQYVDDRISLFEYGSQVMSDILRKQVDLIDDLASKFFDRIFGSSN